MYIAMNRFSVIPGEESAFEQVWRERETHLHEMKGYRSFNLLRGPEKDGGTLYASHTIWESYADFEAWTKSEQFRAAHAGAGQGKKLTSGHPVFEGFEAVQL